MLNDEEEEKDLRDGWHVAKEGRLDVMALVLATNAYPETVEGSRLPKMQRTVRIDLIDMVEEGRYCRLCYFQRGQQ